MLLELRSFRAGVDEAAYVRVFNACFSDYADIRCMSLEEMRKMEESPSFDADGILIAEWDGELAGMVDAHVDRLREERKGFVQNLGVLPAFRRRGIAKRLVTKALESLRLRGMGMAEAWAQSDREACVRLYEGFGFTQARAMSMMKRGLAVLPSDVGEDDAELAVRDMRMDSEEDFRLLNLLENEAFNEHFNFRPKSLEETKYDVLELPWFSRRAWFFALLGGGPVGFAGVTVDEGMNDEKRMKAGWIYDIGVLKPYRRKGVGTRLMVRSLQALKAMGMREALLYVDDMNPTGAITFYEGLGFTVAKKSIIYQLKLA